MIFKTSTFCYSRISILLPLLLISYLTLKTALGRVEDANRHLCELNTLYLSTIETLAMAIDAKDRSRTATFDESRDMPLVWQIGWE